MRRRRLIVIVVAIGVVLAVALPAANAASRWHRCSGVVQLSYGDAASSISALNLTCRNARSVIKAPATRLGYRCSNPFRHPKGSGGWITCRKAQRGVKFLYSQS